MSVMPHDEPQVHAEAEPTLELDIVGRPRDLGDGFTVRRILPSAARRMVGPFIFVDHMGPVHLKPGDGLDVRPHPHINLATVTFLFEGEILHRDSLGSEQLIRPGAVNWMTAGSGIVHSERSPSAARGPGPTLHGMQLWVALPTAHEEDAPSFQHHAASTIPTVERPGARLTIIAGRAYDVASPVQTASPLFYVEARLDKGARLELPDEYRGRAVYVVDGVVELGGQADQAVRGGGNMLVVRPGRAAHIVAHEAAHLLLLGGQPLDGERHIWWNFVSSSQERLDRAKADWRERRFPRVPGDEVEFIPLPEDR